MRKLNTFVDGVRVGPKPKLAKIGPRPVETVMAEAIQDEGYITIRLAGQVYDTRRKQFAGFRDGTITFKARNPKGVGLAMDKIVAALAPLTK